MKANFMKKTCAWVMTTVTVATAIVPNTVNVAFAADVEPDTNTSMQIDDADVSANTSITPVEDETPAEDNTTVEEPAVEEPTQTTEEQPTVAPTEDANASTDKDANKDADVPSEETPSEDATVTEAPKTSTVRFSVPKKGGKVVVNTNIEGSQPVDVLTNEKDYSYKLENVEVGTVISTEVQCDNGYDVASYHVLKDTGKGMVELLEANEVDRVDLEKLEDFVASCTTYKHNITVGEDPIVVEVVFEETKKDENATTDETKKDDSDAAKDVTTEETTDETKKDDSDVAEDSTTEEDNNEVPHKVVLNEDIPEEYGVKLDHEDGVYKPYETVTVSMNELEEKNAYYSVYATNLNDEDADKNIGIASYNIDNKTFMFTMPNFDVSLVVSYNEDVPVVAKEYKSDVTYLNLNEDFDESSLKESDFYLSTVTKDYYNVEVQENTVDTSVLGDYRVVYHVTSEFGDDFTVVFPVSVVEDKDNVDVGDYSVSFGSNSDSNVNIEYDKQHYNEGEEVKFTVTPMNGYGILAVHAVNKDKTDSIEEYELKQHILGSEENSSEDSITSTADENKDTENANVDDQMLDNEEAQVESSENVVEDDSEDSDSNDSDLNIIDTEDGMEISTDDTDTDEPNLIDSPVEYTFTMPANNVDVMVIVESAASTLDIDVEKEEDIKKYSMYVSTESPVYYDSAYTSSRALTYYRQASFYNSKGKLVGRSGAYCVQSALSAPEGSHNMGMGTTLSKRSLLAKALYFSEAAPTARGIKWGSGMSSWNAITGTVIYNGAGSKPLTSGKENNFTNVDSIWGEPVRLHSQCPEKDKDLHTRMGTFAKNHFILSYLYGYENNGNKTPTSSIYYPGSNTSFWTDAGKTALNKLAKGIIGGFSSENETIAVDLYQGNTIVRGKAYAASELSEVSNGYALPVLTYKAPSWNTGVINVPASCVLYIGSKAYTGVVKLAGGTSFKIVRTDGGSGKVNFRWNCR